MEAVIAIAYICFLGLPLILLVSLFLGTRIVNAITHEKPKND